MTSYLTIEACGGDIKEIDGMKTTSTTDAVSFVITTTTSIKCK
jgi:hypothetical protein